jgi:flagellar protein FlaG
MELDAVSSKAYQGSVSKVSVKPVQPVQPAVTEAPDKVNVNIEPVLVKQEEKEGSNKENSKNSGLFDVNSNELKKSISEINSKINKNTEAVFGIHEETHRVTIKIVDKDTKEVIKEIPPEKTLEMIAKIWEVAGILVDEKR